MLNWDDKKVLGEPRCDGDDRPCFCRAESI